MAPDPDGPPRELPIAELAPGAALLARAQIDRARRRLTGLGEAPLVFPFRELDDMVHPVRAGRVVLVGAATGQGKTTFVLNIVRNLLRQNVPQPQIIDLIGTEQEPDELWTKLACLDARVPAGVAINADWDNWPEPDAFDRVDTELLMLQTAYGESGRLKIVPVDSITLDRVEAAAEQAYNRGATLLIIDHVDRVEIGDKDQFEGTRHLARRLVDLARIYNLVIIAASQLNLQAYTGDRLAVNMPPRIATFRGGGSKAEEASIVLGLFRPVRNRKLGEDIKTFSLALREARKGERPTSEVLSKDRMGVTLMKHRTTGNEGAGCFLHFDRGVLSDQQPPLAVI